MVKRRSLIKRSTLNVQHYDGAAPAAPILPWWAGGLGIGLILIVAVGLVEPIGVSTQYVVAVGVLLHELLPTVAADSPYLLESVDGWTILTYEFMFVLGIPIGAYVAAFLTNRLTWRVVPREWAARFGSLPGRRLVWSFIGGFVLLFGARFGGGCTSGHMISGVSQLAVSSLVFSATLFLSAVVTARWLYDGGGGSR
ncbi:YeeE/YedE thiosulfate transporter family protein [Petrachloros mirabilis]